MNNIKRLVPALAAAIALSIGGIGVAQASNGADDPAGHDAKDDHGQHHGKRHHRANDDGGARHGGNDDGPNHR